MFGGLLRITFWTVFTHRSSRSGLPSGRRYATLSQLYHGILAEALLSRLKGTEWPANGEIDIIEAVNVMTNNQAALHTTAGCTVPSNSSQTGKLTSTDCSQGSGCVVAETAENSYGEGFAAAGGGVWATQFDNAGI